MCDGCDNPPEDRRKNKTCLQCRKRKCEHSEDEICQVCWDAAKAAANRTRIARIESGWIVDSTGGIHPPNNYYALRDTRIEVAGVLRCCLATVAEEYEGGDKSQDKNVAIGAKSKCRHCNQTFTLIEAKPHPKWKPDWQLNGHND